MDEINLETLSQFMARGDRDGYYSYLEGAGIQYGALAGGVVREDSISGRLANTFLAERALELGIEIDQQLATRISVDLMRADFDARVAAISIGDSAEIGVDRISRYHEQVEGVRGTPPGGPNWQPIRSDLSVSPGGQLVETSELVIGDTAEDVGQPRLRIDAVELRGLDQGEGDRG